MIREESGSIIVRCEDSTGHGPYYASTEEMMIVRFPWIASHNNSETHPTPIQDGLPNVRDIFYHNQYQCGFSCLSQMYAWFKEEERIDLIAKGYRFLYLKVNGPVLFGGHQVIFRRPMADIIGPVSEVLSP